MATYPSKFISQLSRATEALRHLAKQTPFTVTEQLREAFESAKSKITQPLLKLAFYNTSSSTSVAILVATPLLRDLERYFGNKTGKADGLQLVVPAVL
jgi:hypothetical protein